MYRQVCPRCGDPDNLFVTWFEASTFVKLKEDGFSVTDAEYMDTDNETVHCCGCDHDFSIAELYRGQGDE
jgi:hypothetical protein